MDQFESRAKTAASMAARQAFEIIMQHNAKITDNGDLGRSDLEHTMHFLLLTENEIQKLFAGKIMEVKKTLEGEKKDD